jgi:Predicted membrane protein (DUF2142)
LVAFVLIFLNMSAWSLATPLFASPDEPTHVVRAVALVRGQLIGNPIPGSLGAYSLVTVPALYAEGNHFPCYAFKTKVPASCARPLAVNTKSVLTTTYVGHYPPLYYVIVGIPSLLTVSPTGIYLMRLVSAALCALFVALALMSVIAWSRRPLLLVGVLLAATPMTLFLAGMVNPNALEICAAICVWTSGFILLVERADAPPRGLLVVVTVSTVVLVLCRSLSPAWAVLIFLCLSSLLGWRRWVKLLRKQSLRVPIAIVTVAFLAAVSWIVAAHALVELPVSKVPANEKSGTLLLAIIGNTGGWIRQMIGVFGWLDTPAPLATHLVWIAATGFVLLCALGTSRRRGILALLALTAAVLLIPVVIAYREAHSLGIDWQGRYILPLAVGIPILATALITGLDAISRFRSRIAVVLCVAIGIGDFAAFITAQRRYATGLPGPLLPLGGRWRPPLGNGVMTLWSLLATALLVGAIAFVVSRPRTNDEAASLQATTSTRSTELELGPAPI